MSTLLVGLFYFMTLSTKQLLTYGAIILALGLLVGFYGGCQVTGVKTVLMPGMSTTIRDSITVHDSIATTEYLRGKPFVVRVVDTEFAQNVGQVRVDTVRYTNEHTVYVPKEVRVHDTIVRHTDTRALFLATANIEHDLLSGYGGAIELDHNLDWLGLRNYAIYASGGLTRGFTNHGEPRLAVGVKIPLWEGP